MRQQIELAGAPTPRAIGVDEISLAFDQIRREEYKRLSGKDRSYIKGQRYTLLSNKEHLDLKGRTVLKKLLAANSRLNTAYLLE